MIEKPFEIPQCSSLNSAGRRCEKSELHNTVETNPVHKAGAVTWNAARGERLSLLDALRKAVGDLNMEPWQAQTAERYFGYDGRGHRGGISSLFHTPDTGEVSAADYAVPTEAERQLAQWWRDKAEAEIGQTVAKAVEYGSTDLIDIGRSMARIAGRNDEIEDDEAAEWGIFFYLEGKLSRWRSALERGDRPSDDTLLDIGVYARMAQRIRSHGGWPGIEDEPEGLLNLRDTVSSADLTDLRRIKIAQVTWAGKDITSFIARKPDGSLDTSFESVGRAAEQAGFATGAIDPDACTCDPPCDFGQAPEPVAPEPDGPPCDCMACKSERSTESREEIDE